MHSYNILSPVYTQLQYCNSSRCSYIIVTPVHAVTLL